MFHKGVFVALWALGALIGATAAQAASHALLVGVSDYDDSIGLADLRGPANDVRLLRDVLTQRGDVDITVLADGVEGGVRPTRAAILGALDDLAATAQAGDFVYIHLSGHGTQQADRNGDESDGLDEVFLPADTARAEPGTNVIPNGIVDEELGAAIRALRTRGADVWFVLDSCHSGSGLRAASPGVATRFVDPAVLGVSAEGGAEPAAKSAVEGPGGDDLPGGYLAFYAAQSSEVAREVRLDETDEGSWYGLFTSRLAARLEAKTALSYRQLFQAVLTDLADANVPAAARLQTPLWEGGLIDAPVFGGGDTVGVRQFAVSGRRLMAGKLHGLQDNTVMALVADAAAGPDEILGYAQVTRLKPQTARLVAVGGDCVASVQAACETIGSLARDAAFARIVAKPLDEVVAIAPPLDLTTGAALDPADPLAMAFAAAIETANTELGLNIQSDPAAAIQSGASNGALWFGQRVAQGDEAVGLSWRPEDGALAPLLKRIAEAERLAEMFGTVAGAPSMLFPNPLEVRIDRVVSDATEIDPFAPGDLEALIEECEFALETGAQAGDLPPGQAMKQCDQIHVQAQGVSQGAARDVNRIHIDSQFCVHASYQRVEGVSRPAALGGPITVCSDCPDDTGVSPSAGVERMFVVVTEAEDNSEALNLEGLVENCVAEGSATRAAGGERVGAFLASLNSLTPTRGALGGVGVSNLWVESFTWRVLPRREALRQAGLDPDG